VRFNNNGVKGGFVIKGEEFLFLYFLLRPLIAAILRHKKAFPFSFTLQLPHNVWFKGEGYV